MPKKDKQYLEKCIEELINYYKDRGLTIIGLNDSQGVNITSTFFRKGMLDYLASLLTTKDLEPVVINAFSLLFNKTEHIDSFLKNNISLEEIKLSQVYSAVSAFQKVMTDLKLPSQLGNVGYAYNLAYRVKPEDKDIRLTTTLKESKEPMLIYSSGVNNLMREVHNNPFAIKKDYQEREIRPNFAYTLEKGSNPQTVKKVLDGMQRNFDNILAINSNTDIYTLGAYIPKTLKVEDMNILKELVLKYNELLEEICKAYHITFIDTENIGKDYLQSDANFHISNKGHNMLALYILTKMYEKKINTLYTKFEYPSEFKYTSNGAEGIMTKLYEDYNRSLYNSHNLDGFDRIVEEEVAQEHLREYEVFKKVLAKTKR